MSSMILLMGYPASGKSTVAAEHEAKGYHILNRDSAGGKVIDLLPKLRQLLKSGKNVLLDNTFPTAESRKPFLDMAAEFDQPVNCLFMNTSIEDAQFNACQRMIRKHGKLLSPDEIKKSKDPNAFPPAVVFMYRKALEKPTTGEGFAKVEKVSFVRRTDKKYKNAAIIFDFDGTLRETKTGGIYPTFPDDVRILPGRQKKLKQLRKAGERILGASSQSGIAKGVLTDAEAKTCFAETILQLGVDIDYEYCPHRIPPLSCWCRKPMPGMGVHFIEKYKLDRAKVTMVGDMTSDKTFATRCGFQYVDAKEFFA